MKNKKTRAFLKWAGGKYSLAERIVETLPPANKLIEPFVGAGSVFLNSDFDSYLLNDINPDLIDLYKTLKRRPQQYIRDARRFFVAQNNTESAYYALREQFNQTTDTYQRNLLFLYLNRHGYNGLCRYNRSGGFNVPFGRYVKPYFPEAELEAFAEKAKLATFTCLPFNQIFRRARQDTVIYILQRAKRPLIYVIDLCKPLKSIDVNNITDYLLYRIQRFCKESLKNAISCVHLLQKAWQIHYISKPNVTARLQLKTISARL